MTAGVAALAAEIGALERELDDRLAEARARRWTVTDHSDFLEWSRRESVDLSNRIKLMARRRGAGLRAEDYDEAELRDFAREEWDRFGRRQSTHQG